jgi:hypothetical protein
MVDVVLAGLNDGIRRLARGPVPSLYGNFMARVELVFTRVVQVVETGVVEVEVDDPENMRKVFGAAERKKFKKLLVMEREYNIEDDEWDFELVEDENDDGPEVA